jgi:SAM-dependent methyltransferase
MKNINEIRSKEYDEDYFEKGVQTGKSGYQNYSWLPELTIKMAHHLITNLNINNDNTVLDYGCAKGFLVKAFRLLDIEAYGVDVSDYAINKLDNEVRKYCKLIKPSKDNLIFERQYDWLISKDVFEHMTPQELKDLLKLSKKYVKNIFAAIPLGLEDSSGFIIEEYNKDITHVTSEPLKWWLNLFEQNQWKVSSYSYKFRGVKDAWTDSVPEGNAFFLLKNLEKIE